MPRKTRQLQWHKASSQWCKGYTDPTTSKKKVKYLGRGTANKAGTGGILDELYDDVNGFKSLKRGPQTQRIEGNKLAGPLQLHEDRVRF
jgi:hypothetical protein